MDGSVDRDTPDELSYSTTVVTVYCIWGVIFLLLVLALCIVGLVPLATTQRYCRKGYILMVEGWC